MLMICLLFRQCLLPGKAMQRRFDIAASEKIVQNVNFNTKSFSKSIHINNLALQMFIMEW